MGRAEQEHPVAVYARKVLSGEIVAGRLVRLACKRQLDDLEHGHERGLRFDCDAANRALQFFSHIRLPDRDEPFTLTLFWQFIVGSIFGWLGPDGYRRFRTAYCELGKGQGKTPVAAGIGLFGITMDNEQAAEVYTAGVTRDQAAYLLEDAKKIVDASPNLRNRLKPLTHNIAYEKTMSYMRGVSSEARTLDQKRVHMALIDEIHEHPNSLVVDKMRAGTKARRQALIFEITNSGYDKTSVCWQHHEYSEKVLEGVRQDDSWFAYICQLDPCDKCFAEGKKVPSDTCKACDDWRDEKTWIKANPNLGVSITKKYLEEQVREAVGMPSKENIVKRLNFCVWTATGVKGAIPMDKWRSCATKLDLEELRMIPAHAGLDLGLDSDLSAFVLVFEHGEKFLLKPYFWIPQSLLDDKSNPMRDQYRLWARDGYLRVTPGNTVDYDVVRADICDLAGYERPDSAAMEIARTLPEGQRGAYDNPPLDGPFYVESIRVDRTFQGAHICTQLLGDGFKVESFGQGFLSMTAPTKAILEAIKNEKIEHLDHPVLNWMASNFAVEVGPAGIKPTKQESGGKIDGIVSAIMGTAGIIGTMNEDYSDGSLLDRDLMQDDNPPETATDDAVVSSLRD